MCLPHVKQSHGYNHDCSLGIILGIFGNKRPWKAFASPDEDTPKGQEILTVCFVIGTRAWVLKTPMNTKGLFNSVFNFTRIIVLVRL